MFELICRRRRAWCGGGSICYLGVRQGGQLTEAGRGLGQIHWRWKVFFFFFWLGPVRYFAPWAASVLLHFEGVAIHLFDGLGLVWVWALQLGAGIWELGVNIKKGLRHHKT